MASSKALDDDQLILMAWEVGVRRGWAFVMDTLLRGGIELFPPDSSTAEEKGLWEGVGRGTQVGLLSPPYISADLNTLLVSQEESGDEEEESPLWDMHPVSSSEVEGQKRTRPSGGGHGLNISLGTNSSSPNKSPNKIEDQLNLSKDSKMAQFLAEATIFFNKYFSKPDVSAGAQDLSARRSGESKNEPSVNSSSVVLADSLPEVSSSNVPSERLPIPAPRLPLAVPLQAKSPVQQVAMVPAMPASQYVAVTEPALQQPTNKTSFLPPLAGHICKELQDTVVSLSYFNMFGLLRIRSHEIFLSQTEIVHYYDSTIYNWQKGFLIMGSILLENAPEKMKGFFFYGETICSLYKNETGPVKSWLIYDEEFRKLKARQPDLGWDAKHSELMQQFFRQPVTFASSIEFHPTKMKAASSAQPVKQNRGECWQYNVNECKMGSLCRYYHVCSHCSGEHSKIYCPKLNSVSSTPPLKRTK